MLWLLLQKSFLNSCCSLSGKSLAGRSIPLLLTGGCEVCPYLLELLGAQENLGFSPGVFFCAAYSWLSLG